jgi:hypothetical protein
MRVKVNDETPDTIGEPEHVSAGRMADDFCIDENAGVAYLTTHRENTLIACRWIRRRNSYRFIVAGNPLNDELIGLSSAARGTLPREYGKVAYTSQQMVALLSRRMVFVSSPMLVFELCRASRREHRYHHVMILTTLSL